MTKTAGFIGSTVVSILFDWGGGLISGEWGLILGMFGGVVGWIFGVWLWKHYFGD